MLAHCCSKKTDQLWTLKGNTIEASVAFFYRPRIGFNLASLWTSHSRKAIRPLSLLTHCPTVKHRFERNKQAIRLRCSPFVLGSHVSLCNVHCYTYLEVPALKSNDERLILHLFRHFCHWRKFRCESDTIQEYGGSKTEKLALTDYHLKLLFFFLA